MRTSPSPRLLATFLCSCFAAVVLLATSVASAHARASAQYRIEGRGWGHGIGMSQYGAAGFAQRGWTVDRIVQHYYQGTVVAPRPADGPTHLRVLLQSYLAPARIQVTAPATLRQGDQVLELAAGDVVAMRATAGGALLVSRARTGTEVAELAPSKADATIVPSVDGGARILFDADHARSGTAFRGTLTGHVFDGKVSVFNTVAFESYLRGVVPDEMPPSWHPEALKAQAIAARSYALRSLRTDFNWFDVYSDTRSQVYGGVGAEEASTDAAIAATAGQVARVGGPDGEVAQTFFFSTSGGRTAGNEEVWRSSPYSYLRPVASPHEHASPYFFWKGAEIKRYTPARMGAALGHSKGFRSAAVTVHPSGYAKDVVVRTTSGTRTINASTIQSRLGLRSTFFRLQFLSLLAPDAAATGKFVTLSGRVPTSGKTTLVLRRGANVRTVVVKRNGPNGQWRVRTRMTGNLLVSLTRSGIPGPRLFIRASEPAPGPTPPPA